MYIRDICEAIMKKITLIISAAIMVISYIVAIVEDRYDYPILIGTISGIIFLCCDFLVFMEILAGIKKEKKKH